MSEPEADLKALKELVDRHAHQLAEHFDSVQIFVTRQHGEVASTGSYETGVGNFYARFGQVREWLIIQEQYQRNEAIRRDARDRS